MSDLLHVVSWIQTATSVRTYLRIGGWLLAALAVWMFWASDSPLARWIGFIAVDVALYLGIITFMRAPAEWLRYLFVSLIFVSMAMSQIIIKVTLMGMATILSVIYFLSPIDIIPDLLLGLGWIDDALIAWGLISYAAKSQYALPVPSISVEEAVEHPAWKVASIAVVSTCLAGLLRAATG